MLNSSLMQNFSKNHFGTTKNSNFLALHCSDQSGVGCLYWGFVHPQSLKFSLLLSDTLRNETQRERFNADFATYAPIYFLYERETHKSLTASKAFREKYFQNQPLVYPNSLEKFGQLYSDGLIGFEYYRYLHMIVKHVPVYTYMFNYKGRYSFFINPDTNQTYGIV